MVFLETKQSPRIDDIEMFLAQTLLIQCNNYQPETEGDYAMTIDISEPAISRDQILILSDPNFNSANVCI